MIEPTEFEKAAQAAFKEFLQKWRACQKDGELGFTSEEGAEEGWDAAIRYMQSADTDKDRRITELEAEAEEWKEHSAIEGCTITNQSIKLEKYRQRVAELEAALNDSYSRGFMAGLEEAYQEGWECGRDSTSVTGNYKPDWNESDIKKEQGE
jgi:hypothetical protein